MYKKLMKFWDDAFKGMEPAKIIGKSIVEDSFNKLISDYIKEGDFVIDYGCGSAWASFEIVNSFKNLEVIGIDTSNSAIEFANKCVKLSNFDNLKFVCGDENVLDTIDKKADVIISFNVLDVLPNDVIISILEKIKVHSNGKVIIGINPDFPLDFLMKMGYEAKDGLLFKDGILRGNLKSEDEWISLFKKYFKFIELRKVAVSEREKQFPRRVFILESN